MRLREHPAIGEGRTDILPADPRLLSVMEGYNVRDLSTPEARAELDELKALVKEHGVKTPLVVRFDGEKIWIVEGHRRHKVALELIAEHDASDGAEGRNIDYVPIKAEAPGTSEVDRDFGLETSNSGSRLKPLELANLIYRMMNQRGLSIEAVAKGLGKTVQVCRNHLDMRAMPEGIKQEVAAGTVSASTASRMLKNLPKGTDPALAQKIIKDAAEEKQRLTGKGRATPKAINRAIERTKPKAPEPEKVTEAPGHSPLSDDRPPVAALHEQLRQDAGLPPTEPRREPQVREFPPEAFRPPTLAQDFDREMFAIVARLATIGESHDLNQVADDFIFEVPAEVIKAADRAYRSRIGDEQVAA